MLHVAHNLDQNQGFNHLGHLLQELIDRNNVLEDENIRLHHEIEVLRSMHTGDSTNSSTTKDDDHMSDRLSNHRH
jgi:hypothetical protein